MRNALVTSIALVAFVAPASAQQPAAQQREAEARERQQLVQYMEDLKGAVSAGASSMVRQVRRESPRAELGMANPIFGSRPRTARLWPRSVVGSMACRSPSSSRPHGSKCSRPRNFFADSTTTSCSRPSALAIFPNANTR